MANKNLFVASPLTTYNLRHFGALKTAFYAPFAPRSTFWTKTVFSCFYSPFTAQKSPAFLQGFLTSLFGVGIITYSK